MRRLSIVTVLLIVSLTIVGCGNSGQAPGTDQVQQSEPFSASVEIVMENGTKKYDPMEVTVTGNNGTIEVTNKLDVEHGFVIRQFGIKAAIPGGETRTFQIDSAAPGEYMIDCHLHSAHAEGTLVVQAP